MCKVRYNDRTNDAYEVNSKKVPFSKFLKDMGRDFKSLFFDYHRDIIEFKIDKIRMGKNLNMDKLVNKIDKYGNLEHVLDLLEVNVDLSVTNEMILANKLCELGNKTQIMEAYDKFHTISVQSYILEYLDE